MIYNQNQDMQKKLSRVCTIAEHDERLIEYICMHPQCNLNRFACGKCVKIGNHKHQQQDQSHVLDNKELYEVLKEKLNKGQRGEQFQLKNKGLQMIIQELHKLLQNVRNIIEQIEQGMDFNQNDQQLNVLLLKVRNHGLNQFDDIQLNMLMNIDKQPGDIYTLVKDKSNTIIQNAIRIQQWCYYQQKDNSVLQDKIKNSKDYLITQDSAEGDNVIYSSAISNDFKYIVCGGTEKKLKIWNYSNNKLIKQIQLDDWINRVKFTDDSKFLYVGKQQDLYQFDVVNNFKEAYNQALHIEPITNIFCITNTIILTSSFVGTIIKTDINLKQQLLLIKAHVNRIDGLDYNHKLNLIASSSDDKSIKLWNGNNGQTFLEKQNAHNNDKLIDQVLFIINKNQLISLDNFRTAIIWNINYETRQLEQQQQISDTNIIQYITTIVCTGYIKIYSIKGDYVRQFNHDVKEFSMNNVIQPQSMNAFIIKGRKILQICKVNID